MTANTLLNTFRSWSQLSLVFISWTLMGGTCTNSNTGTQASTWNAAATAPYDLQAISFTSQSVGYAAGVGGAILKTSDSGKTWQKVGNISNNDIKGLFFSDNSNGWAVGNGPFVVRTTDGGVTWQGRMNGIPPQSVHVCGDLWNFYQILFLPGTQTAWVAGDQGVYMTTTGGDSWTSLNYPISAGGTRTTPYGLFFLDDQRGWVVGQNGSINSTSNGGRSWVAQSSGTTLDLRSVYLFSNGRGFAVGGGGLTTGIPPHDGCVGRDVQCVPICPSTFPPASGVILITSDFGATWNTLQTSNDPHLKIIFKDTQHGWIVGGTERGTSRWRGNELAASGHILGTRDGGLTWTQQEQLLLAPAFDVSFIDLNTGFVMVGFSGMTWSNRNNPTTGVYSSDPHPTSSTLYITTTGGW